MEDIQKIAKETRDSLSEYCISECKSYCCRKGYLPLSEEELDLIAGDKKEMLLIQGFVKEMLNGKYILNFENCFHGCPRLKEFKCMIHDNEKRPQTCKDFPIFILGKKVKISPRCPAKKENKFFKFEKDAKKLGYEIVEDFF